MASFKVLDTFDVNEGTKKIISPQDWYVVRKIKPIDEFREYHQLILSKSMFDELMKIAKADPPKDDGHAFVVTLNNFGREAEL